MKVNHRRILIFISLVFFLTFFRAGYLIFALILPLWLYFIFSYRISIFKLTLFLSLLFLILISSMIKGYTPFVNTLFSFYLILPFFVLLIANPKCYIDEKDVNFKTLESVLIFIAIINNLFGLFQFLFFRSTDSFIGLYGRHSIGVHGLAIINAIFFIFYFSKFYWLRKKSLKTFFCMFFFFVCHFLGFYGYGLIVLLASIIIVVFFSSISLKKLLKLMIFVFPLLLILFLWDPLSIFNYMYSNIRFIENFRDGALNVLPGKIRMFFISFDYAYNNIDKLVFGLGPGGYNSRVSFLLNDDSSNIFTLIFGHWMPFWHKSLIHPLWDLDSIDARLFNDGTRNQPFSSFISLSFEYGIVFFLFLIGFFFTEIKKCKREIEGAVIKSEQKNFLIKFINLLTVFFGFIFLGENIVEMSEGLIFVLILYFVKVYIHRIKASSRVLPD